jgi:hypothetical protein
MDENRGSSQVHISPFSPHNKLEYIKLYMRDIVGGIISA